jgi:2-oxoglutarate dehydrogenase E2 component (dihydrolipoamide succinyltransferase)
MSDEILVPALGESITEATVAKWLKKEGEEVSVDESLVELETDKVNIEVPSPASGILSKINMENGSTVEVGAILGEIGAGATNIAKIKKEKIKNKKIEEEKQDTTEKPSNGNLLILDKPISEKKKKIFILDNPIEEEKEQATSSLTKSSLKTLSPAVRKIAEEKNIDLNQIEGSGKKGMILKGDLLVSMGATPKPSTRKIQHGPEERIKMSRLRLTIAKRLKEAQENAAILTTFNEVDMKNIIEMRKNYQEDFQKTFSVKLGFMSFFVKACIVGLKNFPAINAEIDGEDVVYKNYYNMGIAVGTDKGLVVPVLKNCDQMSFANIEKNISILSDKAKKGKIGIEDLQGGTFTISNGGIYGSMLSTPILNPPQSGVLGMHNIVDRATVVDGQIVARPIMYVALSYDHRIIDGKEAVSFLKCVKDYLEEPRRLFLDL